MANITCLYSFFTCINQNVQVIYCLDGMFCTNKFEIVPRWAGLLGGTECLSDFQCSDSS